MRNTIVFGSFAAILFGLVLESPAAERGDGRPVRFLASCEMDFDDNGLWDVGLLMDTKAGLELVVLMREKKGFQTHKLHLAKSNSAILQCNIGNSIKETAAGGGKGRTLKTNGAYLKLIWPESSSAAFYWSGKEFKKVFTAD